MELCPFFPEVQIGYTCDKGCDLREPRDCTADGMKNCPAVDWACKECPSNKTCEFAFDLYNLDGDCLMDK